MKIEDIESGVEIFKLGILENSENIFPLIFSSNIQLMPIAGVNINESNPLLFFILM
jgi:hypothetical protein